jgi:TPR repeat protein
MRHPEKIVMRASTGSVCGVRVAGLAAIALLLASVAPFEAAGAASLAAPDVPVRTRFVVGPRLEASAKGGDARAQAKLGFAYEYGYGVPQDYAVAILWYRRAAQRGNATGQYLLGLMYDRGQGVSEDTTAAQKWLILAAANTTGRQHDYYARIRDAVASKMTVQEIAKAQALAYAWSRDHRR